MPSFAWSACLVIRLEPRKSSFVALYGMVGHLGFTFNRRLPCLAPSL
jgi:hypothetical protein